MCTVQLAGIQTVVFDLDDTLLAERDYAYSGFAAVADWLTSRVACPFDTSARMRALFETGNRHRIFDQLLSEIGCDRPGQLVPAMVDCYRHHMPRIGLLPDAERALCRWQGLFLALVSDGWLEVQRQKVASLGLESRLDLIVLTDEWGREFWKPHPRSFYYVEQSSGHRGSACVYIADNPTKDFVVPNRIGWHTIQVCREGGIYADIAPVTDGRPEFRVMSLDEVDIK